MPRTTLRIEEDALEAAKTRAERHRITLGQAVSELIREGAERPLITEERGGLRIVHLGPQSPRVTADLVDRLRDDIP